MTDKPLKMSQNDEFYDQQKSEFTDEDLDRLLPRIYEIMLECFNNEEYRKEIRHITKLRKRREAYAIKKGKKKQKRSG